MNDIQIKDHFNPGTTDGAGAPHGELKVNETLLDSDPTYVKRLMGITDTYVKKWAGITDAQ